MPCIVRTQRAKADVLTIGRFIAEQSGNRSVALGFLDRIDAKLKFLARNPLAGEARPDLLADVRSFPVGNYVIFYRPSQNGIEVLRILHGARDIPRIFRTGENEIARHTCCRRSMTAACRRGLGFTASNGTASGQGRGGGGGSRRAGAGVFGVQDAHLTRSSETRNPKQIQNSNIHGSKQDPVV